MPPPPPSDFASLFLRRRPLSGCGLVISRLECTYEKGRDRHTTLGLDKAEDTSDSRMGRSVICRAKYFLKPHWKTHHPLVMNELLPLLDALLSNQQLCFPRLLLFLSASRIRSKGKKKDS